MADDALCKMVDAREPADAGNTVQLSSDGSSSDFLSSLTNFSIQYNYGCAGMATAIMLSHSGETGLGVVPDYPQPMWAKYCLLSVVFVGSMVGMLVMGPLGDFVGVKQALVLTNSLMVLGALSSALLSWGSSSHIWLVIMVGRFILGVGVGGGYPLSAARAAQGAAKGKGIEQTAKAFFWQGPGSLAPYLVALVLLQVPPFPGNTAFQFRMLLGLGAVPAFVVVWCALREPGAALGQASKAAPAVRASRECGVLAAAVAHPEYWRKLIGIAGTWFLFDVVFYSLLIYAPTLVVEIFGPGSSLVAVALHAMVFAGLSTIGCAAGLWLLIHCRVSAKTLNTRCFAAAAVIFAVIAAVFKHMPNSQTTLFSLVCILFLALSVGPNVATFVLPIETFPPDVQGTFGGLSSACGKAGAMVGAAVFPALVDGVGIGGAMAAMSLVCLVGAGTSHHFLKDRGGGCPLEVESDKPLLAKAGVGALTYYG